MFRGLVFSGHGVVQSSAGDENKMLLTCLGTVHGGLSCVVCIVSVEIAVYYSPTQQR